jgi:hypothetical protein
MAQLEWAGSMDFKLYAAAEATTPNHALPLHLKLDPYRVA